MSYLPDAKTIDMNASKLAIDEKITELQKSGKNKAELEKAKAEKKRQKENGDYEFTEMKYVDYKGDREARPPYWFTWCRWEPANNYLELREWKAKWNYTPVNVDEDNYWPFGLAPNSAGEYTFGDLIFVKCPLIDYLKKRQVDVNMSRGGAKAKLKKFHTDMNKAGGAIPEDMMDEMLGELL